MLILWGLTEVPCSRVGVTRKDCVVQAGLWAGIAAASVEKRTAHLLWGTSQDRNAVVYNLQNKPQSDFLLKGAFILQLEENRKEKKKESRKSRGKQGHRGTHLFCRSASSHSAALALSCPLLCSLPVQLAELRRCACGLSAGAGWQPGSDHEGQPTESPHGKIQYLGLQELHLSLPKTRLKRTYPWGGGWRHYQPEECVCFSIPVNLEGKGAYGWAPSYMLRLNIQAAVPS